MKNKGMKRKLLLFFSLFVFIGIGYSKEKLILSLKDVVRLALKNNLDLQSLKKDYRLSDLEYLYVISPYSISAGVGGSYYYAREKNYGIYAISGDITKRTSGYVFVRKLFRTGTSIEVRYQIDKTETNPQSSVMFGSLPSTLYQGTLSINIKQSLIKNFLGRQDKLRISASKYKAKSIKEKIYNAISNIVSKGVVLYLNAGISKMQMQSAYENLQNTLYVYKVIQRRYRLGTSDYADVVQWESLINQAKVAYNSAVSSYKKSLIELKNFLGIKYDKDIILKASLIDRRFVWDESALIREALKERYDIKSAYLELKSKELSLKEKELERLPDVNLVLKLLTYGKDEEFSSAISSSPNFDYKENYVGFEAVYTFDNKKAYADYKKAREEYLKAKLSYTKLLSDVRADVIKALEDVRNNYYAYKMAKENLAIAKRLFNNVFKEYKLGRYNVFRLKDALSSLTKAKENYNIRLISYNISLINLDMVVGRITKRFGVNPKKFLEDFGK